ncbi:MAG: arginase family protein [Parvibaculaceae bacterium]
MRNPTSRPISLIEAPSNLGLMPPAPGREPGTRNAPETLRRLGLHERLKPFEVLDVAPPPYRPDDERTINIRNLDAIAEHAVRLAGAVETTVRAGRFPLVLGGDCSLLIGAMLGLRRIDQTALLFIDGHTDFYLPEQSGTGGAAGLDLALATGWGPKELTDIEGRRPYVETGRAAVLGNRDARRRRPADIPDTAAAGFHYRPLEALRSEGIAAATLAAIEALDAEGTGYWIHLDVDVLDSTIMPAVDSPQPDGLSWTELKELLRAALSGHALGLQVTIYDPDRDPDLAAGGGLVELLSNVLLAA